MARQSPRADNPLVLPRFHAPDLQPGSTAVTLETEETHHLVHVLRLKRGAVARVFDGEGHEWEGSVASLDKRGAVIDELRPVPALAEARVAITLVAGILRGAAMDVLVRDAAMLGAVSIVPVHTDYSSESRRAPAQAAHLARWRRIVIGACKQCGRAVVPSLGGPESFADALKRPTGVKLILVEPTITMEATQRLEDLGMRARSEGATLAIGPEGGWSPAELDMAARGGFHPWSLGSQVLRAESVPVAALSIARYAWEGN